MKKKLISFTKAVLPLVLGVFLLWLLLRGYDLKKIYGIIAGADFKWGALSIVTMVCANINRSVRWNMLLKPLGYKPRLINTYFSVQIGYFYNAVFPRAGEVSRCSMLLAYEKIPLDKSLGTVVTERVIDVLTLFLCVLLVLIFEFNRVNKLAQEKIITPTLTKFGSLVHGSAKFYAIAVVAIILIAAVAYVALRFLRNTAIYTKIIGIIKGFGQGLQSVRKLDNIGWFLFHTVCMWFFYVLGAYVCFRCFDFTSHLGLFTGFVVMTFGAFAYVTPVPNGIGIYPLIIGQVLLSYGILDYESQQAFGWTAWTFQLAGILALGLLCLILFPIINRTQLVSDESPATGTK